MITSLFIAVALFRSSGVAPSVQGQVSTDGGAPVAGVSVTAAGSHIFAVTDSSGGYALSGLAPGSYAIRFARMGYHSLTVSVLVASGLPTRVDVTMEPEALALPYVRVQSGRILASQTARSEQYREPGSWHASQRAIRESPRLAEPDVFGALAEAPAVQMAPEFPTTLHVRGGSADQNLVLLDGIPIENAVHPFGALSGLNPDAVSEVSLGGGTTSARYGGGLSGLVNISTLDAPRQGVLTRGSLGPSMTGALVATPIRRIGGGAVLSIRQTYASAIPALVAGGSDGPSQPHWRDVFAKVTARVAGSDVSALALATRDEFGFNARVDPGAVVGGEGTLATGLADTSGAGAGAALQDRFDWSASAAGLALKHALGGNGTVDAHVWLSEAIVHASWAAAAGPILLTNRLQRTGGSAVVTWPASDGHITTGVQLERAGTLYDIAPGSGVTSSLLHLGSRPWIASSFLERQWSIGRWDATAGIRAEGVSGAGTQLEPRISFSAKLPLGIRASLGYARTHQFLQSLRNEESILDAVVGVNLPVAAGSGGIPVAGADAVSANITVELAPHTRLMLEAYARRLNQLVLVAPATGEPFALSRFDTGAGNASGAGATLVHDGQLLSWDVAGAFARLRRTAGSGSYEPSFAPRVSGSLGATYTASQHTRFRFAAWVAGGRRTTAVADPFTWDWQNSLTRQRDISGTPQRYGAPIGSTPLSPYARIDIGVRHDIVLRVGADLTMFAGIQNVLNAQNVFGYALAAQGATQTLGMMPRSVIFGLDWRH